MCVCVCVRDPLCDNPAKVIFYDLLFSTKKNHPSYGKEHSVKILPLYLYYWRKVMSNIEMNGRNQTLMLVIS